MDLGTKIRRGYEERRKTLLLTEDLADYLPHTTTHLCGQRKYGQSPNQTSHTFKVKQPNVPKEYHAERQRGVAVRGNSSPVRTTGNRITAAILTMTTISRITDLEKNNWAGSTSIALTALEAPSSLGLLQLNVRVNPEDLPS